MLRLEEHKKPQENFFTKRFYPRRVVLPLSQHTGKPSRLVVEKSQQVRVGQKIAEADGFISASLHSPVSGKITDIKYYNHPTLFKALSVIIQSEEESEQGFVPRKTPEDLSGEEILEIIRESGIVGLGGACFPTQVKLKPPKEIDTLIINGAECEPYLTCDFRLMVEHTEAIIKALGLLARVLNPQKIIIAVEDNKREAIKRFNSKLHTKKYFATPIEVVTLPTVYPQGAEKQLVYNLVRRKVPAGGFPFDVGCVVQNVGTVFSIYEAVYFRKPLIERVITFAGSALVEPKNLWIRIGTLLSELVEREELKFKKPPAKVIFGGPMMGKSVESLDYPLLKGTSGVVFLSGEEIDLREESNCIRCARCVDSCPMGLLPLEYVKRIKKGFWSELKEYYLFDCIECGSCAYVCPSKIPIVNYIKVGKQKVKDLEGKK